MSISRKKQLETIRDFANDEIKKIETTKPTNYSNKFFDKTTFAFGEDLEREREVKEQNAKEEQYGRNEGDGWDGYYNSLKPF